MTIRPAQAGDHSEIYSLVQTAFATAKVSDGTEQGFVLELRRRDTYRPELELVAEENGQLIGHILLTMWPPCASGWRTGTGAWAASFSTRGAAGRRSWGTTPCF